jgi:hypothetical protein
LPPQLEYFFGYPGETVVSEMLEATGKLGVANTGMKDFHNLHSLSKIFEFDEKALVERQSV